MGSSVPGYSSSCCRCCTPRSNTGCFVTLPGTCVYYTGTSLSGPGINRNDTFNVVVEKLTDYIETGVTTQMSITSDSSGLRLVNDEASPGNSQYYGTDSGGVKGFFDLPTSGGGFTVAQNGVSSPDAVAVEWGQPLGTGDAGPALLIDSREIPFISSTMTFYQDSNMGITFAPPILTMYGQAIGGTAAAIQFNDNNGQGGTIVAESNRLVINQTFGQGISLFDTGQIEISTTPSATAPTDPNVMLSIQGNTAVNAWLLRRVKVDSDQADYAIQPEDSGTAYVKIFDGNVFNRVLTLPPATVGLIYHFGYFGNGTVFIQVVAQGTDNIAFGDPSTNPGFAGAIECNNTGATITLCCLTEGLWHPLAQVGIWA